jgi:hypothetical protein
MIVTSQRAWIDKQSLWGQIGSTKSTYDNLASSWLCLITIMLLPRKAIRTFLLIKKSVSTPTWDMHAQLANRCSTVARIGSAPLCSSLQCMLSRLICNAIILCAKFTWHCIEPFCWVKGRRSLQCRICILFILLHSFLPRRKVHLQTSCILTLPKFNPLLDTPLSAYHQIRENQCAESVPSLLSKRSYS